MAKPTGALELNPGHALYGNIVALVIMESDGNVRELATNLSLGIKTTTTLDGELALAESVPGVNLGVDFSDFLSKLDTGDGSFSWGVLAKLPVTWGPTTYWSRYGANDAAASTTGSGSTRFYEDNTQRLRLRGGYSGAGPTASGSLFRTDGTAQLVGTSTVKSAGAWSTNFYKDGVVQGTPSTTSLHALDNPGAGATHYFNVYGTSVSPTIYHVIFDKDLSEAEWAGLTADPYGLVQAAGGGGTSQTITVPILTAARTLETPSVASQGSPSLAPPLLVSNRVLPSHSVIRDSASVIEGTLIVRVRNFPIHSLTRQANGAIQAPLVAPSRVLSEPTIGTGLAQSISTPLLATVRSIPPPTVFGNLNQTIEPANLPNSRVLFTPALSSPQSVTAPIIPPTRILFNPTLAGAVDLIIQPPAIASSRSIPIPIIGEGGTAFLIPSPIGRDRKVYSPNVGPLIDAQGIESIPYPDEISAEIYDVSPLLHKYLEEQTRTLREQHQKFSTGQTTFSYLQLLEIYKEPTYILGSRGRFEHPEYGLVRAMFVKFDSMLEGVPSGGPVGFVKTAEGVSWTVSNDLAASSFNLTAGFLASNKKPLAGDYGWIVTNGPNLHPVRLKNGVTSQVGDELVWSGPNEITNNGGGIAIARQAHNLPVTGQFAVGELFVDISSSTGTAGLASQNARITTLEAEVDTAESRITTVESLIVTNDLAQATVNTTLQAGIDANTVSIVNEQQVQATRNAVLAQEIRRVEGEIEGKAQFLIDIASTASANADEVLYSKIESVALTYRQENDQLFAVTADLRQSLDVVAKESQASISMVSSLSTSIVNAELNLTANADAISTLQTDVNTNESGISANASSITALETTVNDVNTGVVANASAVSSLETLTTSQGDDIASQAGRITSLEASVSNLPVNVDGYWADDLNQWSNTATGASPTPPPANASVNPGPPKTVTITRETHFYSIPTIFAKPEDQFSLRARIQVNAQSAGGNNNFYLGVFPLKADFTSAGGAVYIEGTVANGYPNENRLITVADGIVNLEGTVNIPIGYTDIAFVRILLNPFATNGTTEAVDATLSFIEYENISANAALQSQITANANNIAINEAAVAVNEGNITANASNIATLDSSLNVLTSRVDDNDSTLNTHTIDIAARATNTRVDDVETSFVAADANLQNQVTANANSITNLTATVDGNTTTIDGHTVDIAARATITRVDSVEASYQAADSNLQTSINTKASASSVSTLQAQVDGIDSDLGVVEVQQSVNVTKLDTIQTGATVSDPYGASYNLLGSDAGPVAGPFAYRYYELKPIINLGLSPGGLVSCSALMTSTNASASNCRIIIDWFDGTDALISRHNGTFLNGVFTDSLTKIENLEIPANTVKVDVIASGTTTAGVTARSAMLNRGPVAVEYVAPYEDGADITNYTDARIKNDGRVPDNIHVGGFGDLRFTKNAVEGGSSNDGEIRFQGSKFYHPDGTTRTTRLNDARITTPFEAAFVRNGVFYILWTDEKPTTRFSGYYWDNDSVSTDEFFIAEYDWGTKQWTAVDNSQSTWNFTPLDTDCVVAIGTKTLASGGIGTLSSFLGANANLPADGATVGADWETNLLNPPVSDGAMNKDAGFTGVAGAWNNVETGGYNIGDHGEFAFVTESSSPALGPTILRGTSSNDLSNQFMSDIVPIDVTKTYRVTCWVRQPTGTKRNYLLVGFLDSNGDRINSSSSPLSDATGWPNVGTHHYYGLVNVAGPSTWTKYSVVFGPDQAITMPSNAVKAFVGALVLRNVYTPTVIEFAAMSIEEVTPLVWSGIIDDDGNLPADGADVALPLANANAASIVDIESRWALKVIAGNVVTGIELVSGSGGTSQIKFQADKFLVTDSSGDGNAPFEIVDGVTYIKSAAIQSLTVAKLTDGDMDAELTLAGAAKIVFRAGSYVKVQGIGFGSSNQFVEWYGPNMAFNLMTEANAITYLKTNGDAYFGGALHSGVLFNSVTGTETGVPTSTTLGPFGSNGGASIIVTQGYTMRVAGTRGGDQTSYSGTMTATIKLYQKIGAATETLIATNNITGAMTFIQYDPEVEETSFQSDMSFSATFTDNATTLDDRTYRIEVETRTLFSVGGSGPADTLTQKKTLTSSET